MLTLSIRIGAVGTKYAIDPTTGFRSGLYLSQIITIGAFRSPLILILQTLNVYSLCYTDFNLQICELRNLGEKYMVFG